MKFRLPSRSVTPVPKVEPPEGCCTEEEDEDILADDDGVRLDRRRRDVVLSLDVFLEELL
jgi:hypothetical protein